MTDQSEMFPPPTPKEWFAIMRATLAEIGTRKGYVKEKS
jgi:hypothetical protein